MSFEKQDTNDKLEEFNTEKFQEDNSVEIKKIKENNPEASDILNNLGKNYEESDLKKAGEKTLNQMIGNQADYLNNEEKQELETAKQGLLGNCNTLTELVEGIQEALSVVGTSNGKKAETKTAEITDSANKANANKEKNNNFAEVIKNLLATSREREQKKITENIAKLTEVRRLGDKEQAEGLDDFAGELDANLANA